MSISNHIYNDPTLNNRDKALGMASLKVITKGIKKCNSAGGRKILPSVYSTSFQP